jgi:hypothetical protein
MRRRAFLLGVIPSLAWAQTVPPISPAGARLAALLDGMDVEKLWQPKYRVDWRTGEAVSGPITAPGGHTHCSAFAAAAAERLGVYLLRPPEHPQDWLANAQERWLNDQAGAKAGWTRLGRLADPGASLRAVVAANAGELVVAVYFQPPRSTPTGPQQRAGHIAIIRPSNKPADRIEAEGPDVIQAGERNYLSATLRSGFAAHREGLADGNIEYFAHKTAL